MTTDKQRIENRKVWPSKSKIILFNVRENHHQRSLLVDWRENSHKSRICDETFRYLHMASFFAQYSKFWWSDRMISRAVTHERYNYREKQSKAWSKILISPFGTMISYLIHFLVGTVLSRRIRVKRDAFISFADRRTNSKVNLIHITCGTRVPLFNNSHCFRLIVLSLFRESDTNWRRNVQTANHS